MYQSHKHGYPYRHSRSPQGRIRNRIRPMDRPSGEHGETNRLPCYILCLCRNHSLFESPVTSRKIQHQKRIWNFGKLGRYSTWRRPIYRCQCAPHIGFVQFRGRQYSFFPLQIFRQQQSNSPLSRTIRHSRTDTRLFHGTAVSRHAQPLRDIRTRKNFQTAYHL